MKRSLASLLSSALAVLPAVALAAPPKNLRDLIKIFTDLINPIIGLFTGLAVGFFFWGIVQYILHASDEKKKVGAKETLVYGIIGLFVMFTFWSIVQLLKRSFFP